MGLFGRSKNKAERFPAERLRYLPMRLSTEIDFFARKHGKEVWGSKFVGGYLLGYTTYLDEIDGELGAVMRQMIFDRLFGPERGRDLFERSMHLLFLKDEQTKLGWGASVPDGERFFDSVKKGQDSIDATHSFVAMFEIEMVDVKQQIL